MKASFIPDKALRELRLMTRYRIKLQRNIASEKNRLHKILDGAGIKLGAVVSDIYGTTSQAIIRSLIRGEKLEVILFAIKGRLKGKIGELRKVLQQRLPAAHRFLLQRLPA